MNVVETIRSTIERQGLVPKGSKVVVGVSGGADSVALLRILHALDLSLEIAHLNHQLRGQESDADEAFVRGLALELNVPVVVKSVDVAASAAASGLSIEMAARQARHSFFSEFDTGTIALAHHAGDQVETFILKLARGTGTEGLCGMQYVQQIGSMRLIRPMLDIPRAALLTWLRDGGCAWREDASNADEAFLRNRVRHTILPMLERELNPAIRENILRTMEILREENAWMERMMPEPEPEKASQQPKAVKRRLLRKWLFDHGADPVDYDRVERILDLMERGEGSRIFELNGHQRVVVEYGRPRFEDLRTPQHNHSWIVSLERGRGWRKDDSKSVGNLPAEASFRADKVGDSPIEVRAPLPGDRIEPLGMEGSRKLQDILTDLKIPKARRAAIPVVICRGEIIWLPGYRIARAWAVNHEQEESIHVRIEQKRGD